MSLLEREKNATSLPAMKKDKRNKIQMDMMSTVVPADVIAPK